MRSIVHLGSCFLKKTKSPFQQQQVPANSIAFCHFEGIVFFLEVFWVSACMTCCRVAWRCPFLLVHLKPLVSAAKQGPIKCLSVQYKLSRAKEPSLFSRLNSLERLRDGKSNRGALFHHPQETAP
jgi:hypothetical protein